MNVRPTEHRFYINFRELVTFRELLYFLVWRDLKVRYRQTTLGIFWVVLQPVLMMAIYSVVFGTFVKLPKQQLPYPVFVFAGLLPWQFFASVVSDSGNSFLSNAELIKKVYFPRIYIPVARLIALTSDLLITMALFFAVMFYYRIPLESRLVWFPILVALTLLLPFGVSLLFSSLNVRYRDFQFIIPFVIQVWMFCSPVIYPVNAVPEKFRILLQVNPMVGIIEGYRAVFLGLPLNFGWLLYSVLFTMGILLVGVYYFNAVERTFVDII